MLEETSAGDMARVPKEARKTFTDSKESKEATAKVNARLTHVNFSLTWVNV